jgi:3-oxo-5-alpha-steroid 4-dehydrogenase 3
MEVGLVGLLRVAWIAGILPILIASVPSSRLRVFRDAMLGFAKRGKIMQSSSQVSDGLFQASVFGFFVLSWVCLVTKFCNFVIYSNFVI